MSFYAYKILLQILNGLIMMCLGVAILVFMFLVLAIHWVSWICGFRVFIKFGKISAIISSDICSYFVNLIYLCFPLSSWIQGIRNVSVLLPILSSVSFLGLFLWIFFPIMSSIFLLFCLPGNFYWRCGIVNFALLDTGYFCIPSNILKLFS